MHPGSIALLCLVLYMAIYACLYVKSTSIAHVFNRSHSPPIDPPEASNEIISPIRHINGPAARRRLTHRSCAPASHPPLVLFYSGVSGSGPGLCCGGLGGVGFRRPGNSARAGAAGRGVVVVVSADGRAVLRNMAMSTSS